jgi:hypothetical protein
LQNITNKSSKKLLVKKQRLRKWIVFQKNNNKMQKDLVVQKTNAIFAPL